MKDYRITTGKLSEQEKSELEYHLSRIESIDGVESVETESSGGIFSSLPNLKKELMDFRKTKEAIDATGENSMPEKMTALLQQVEEQDEKISQLEEEKENTLTEEEIEEKFEKAMADFEKKIVSMRDEEEEVEEEETEDEYSDVTEEKLRDMDVDDRAEFVSQNLIKEGDKLRDVANRIWDDYEGYSENTSQYHLLNNALGRAVELGYLETEKDHPSYIYHPADGQLSLKEMARETRPRRLVSWMNGSDLTVNQLSEQVFGKDYSDGERFVVWQTLEDARDQGLVQRERNGKSYEYSVN